MEDFIRTWGYWAVFLGSLVEGESIILTASFMASMGLLSLKKIMFISFCGTLVADQGLYWVGRYYGHTLLEYIQKKFVFMTPFIHKGMHFLEKHRTGYILSFRFIYGVRIISPVILGASPNIPPRVFAGLNIIAAFLWTIISCSGGYFFGDLMMNRLDTYQRYLVLGAVILSIIIFILIKKRKSIFHKPRNL